MKTFAALFCILGVAGIVFADPYSAAIRQARNVANGAPPSGAPPAQTAPSQPPAAPPTDPALEATLRNVSSLRADFAALNNSTNLDSSQRLVLLNNLAAAAQGTKPQANAIKKLAGDLITAMSGKEKMRAQQQKLAQEIHAIFNSSHLLAAQQQAIFDGVKKILQDGGASPDDTEKVVADLQTIAQQTK